MSRFAAFLMAGLTSAVLLSACGGGGGDSASTPAAGGGGGTSPSSVSGVVAGGSPIANATVTITGANSSGSVSTTSGADGSYTANIGALQFPLQISAVNTQNANTTTLRSLALEGQTTANVTPATNAITLAVGNTVTATEIQRVTDLLLAALANYISGADTDFFADATFVANSTGVDEVFDLIDIQFDNANVVLQSRVDPAQTTTFDPNTTTAPTPAPKPVDSNFADPVDIKTLVDALGAVLQQSTINGASFSDVLHDDYQDDEGFTPDDLAGELGGGDLSTTGFQILRCFADTSTVFDACYVRVFLEVPVFDQEEDFGNPNFASVRFVESYDILLERRGNATAPLKFAGGLFKPFAAEAKLFNSNSVQVLANGSTNGNTTVSTGFSLNVPVPPNRASTSNDVSQNVNGMLERAELRKDNAALFTLGRAASGVCSGSDSRLVVDPIVGTNCGNQGFGAFVGTLEADSNNNLISIAFYTNSAVDAPIVREARAVRINNPTSSAIASFGTLNQASLAALHSYGTAQTTPASVTITLTPPSGFNSVCISDGGNNPDICVRSSRQITIPNSMLNGQAEYFILTRDNEGNTFQRSYRMVEMF